MNNVTIEVVNKNLCSGCGVCSGICPTNALSMKLLKNGDLVPHVDSNKCLRECHVCLDICPFSKGVHNPRKKNVELFGSNFAKFNEETGWYLKSFAGSRENAELRKASASGGLATWCLEELLEKRLVTRVAAVRLSKNHHNGYFEFFSASSISELRASSGSIYHPIEISGILKEIGQDHQQVWAIVGVPCLCAAIRNIQRVKNKVPYLFGMACGMYQNTFYTDMLLCESGVDRLRLKKIEYRRKTGCIASNYRFRGTDANGPGKEISYRGLPYHLGKNAFFRLNACNYCMDVFAEAADACFMDAWLPEFTDVRGTSIVLVRNPSILDFFEQGHKRGRVVLDMIGIEKVITSQKGHVRRKRYLIDLRLGNRIDKSSGRTFTISDKITWAMQRYIQRRSKIVWSKVGRNKGNKVFWRRVWDISVMIMLMKVYEKTLGRVIRFGSLYVHKRQI